MVGVLKSDRLDLDYSIAIRNGKTLFPFLMPMIIGTGYTCHSTGVDSFNNVL